MTRERRREREKEREREENLLRCYYLFFLLPRLPTSCSVKIFLASKEAIMFWHEAEISFSKDLFHTQWPLRDALQQLNTKTKHKTVWKWSILLFNKGCCCCCWCCCCVVVDVVVVVVVLDRFWTEEIATILFLLLSSDKFLRCWKIFDEFSTEH